MSAQEENEAVSALTGLSLDQLLTGLSLPASTALSNQLGISGIPALNSTQIYSDKWDEDGAVGQGQGQDWEAEVDREMEEEDSDVSPVKMEEAHSPGGMRQKQKRTRVVRRLIERPKTVYERFPAFERDKVLDFSELFKGFTIRKSRLSKKPFHSMHCFFHLTSIYIDLGTVTTVYPRKKELQRGFLEAVVGDTKRQVESKRVEEVVSSGSVEVDLRLALEVCILFSRVHFSYSTIIPTGT